MKRALLAATVAALAASGAAADEIQLTNGRTIEGIQSTDTKMPGKVVVEVGSGTIVFDAKEVSSVTKGRTALHEYYEKWEAVKNSRKASDFWELSEWARAHKCHKFVAPLCEKVLAMEPGHEGAHLALGHARVGSHWLPFEEAQKQKGFELFEGEWVTAAKKELIQQDRQLARAKKIQEQEERKRLKEEERQRRLDAAQAYHDWLAREMTLPYGYMYQPNWFWPAYYRPYPWTPYKHKLPPNGYYGGGFYGGALPTFDIFSLGTSPFLKR